MYICRSGGKADLWITVFQLEKKNSHNALEEQRFPVLFGLDQMTLMQVFKTP